MNSFQELGLDENLLGSIERLNFSEPTRIQKDAIPLILDGKDVIGESETGSGKTLAFGCGIIDNVARGGGIEALVLTPTRELAAQVADSVRDYGKYLPLRSAAVFGGVSINPQKQKLQKGVDILIATPGRLLDHVGQRSVDLGNVDILVLDEADRMLDMGFIRDIRKIFRFLPDKRQNLLFSATFSDDIRKLANDLLDNPAEIQVAARNTPAERISQTVLPVDRDRKRELLSHRIGKHNMRQVLVFTRTKHGANRLAEQLLQDGISATD